MISYNTDARIDGLARDFIRAIDSGNFDEIRSLSKRHPMSEILEDFKEFATPETSEGVNPYAKGWLKEFQSNLSFAFFDYLIDNRFDKNAIQMLNLFTGDLGISLDMMRCRHVSRSVDTYDMNLSQYMESRSQSLEEIEGELGNLLKKLKEKGPMTAEEEREIVDDFTRKFSKERDALEAYAFATDIEEREFSKWEIKKLRQRYLMYRSGLKDRYGIDIDGAFLDLVSEVNRKSNFVKSLIAEGMFNVSGGGD